MDRILKASAAIVLVLFSAYLITMIWEVDSVTFMTTSRAARKPDAIVKALQPSPQITRMYMNALNHQRNGDYVIAEDLYSQVIALDSQHIYALNNLGVLQMIQRKPEQAMLNFQRAISLKKNYVDPYYNLACVYAQQNELQESLRYLQTAILLKPDLKNWAARDEDLRNIHDSDAFRRLIAN